MSEDDSLNDKTISEEQEVERQITTDDGDEMDDKVVMSNDEEEVDVDAYRMDEHTEIIEEKVEVELNAAVRPNRQCAGAGVERFEMSIDNSKE